MGTGASGQIPPGARPMLGWMHTYRMQLRGMLDEEAALAGEDEDLGPAGDPAIRAHLRFVAEAISANTTPARRSAAGWFSMNGGQVLRESPLFEEQLRLVGEAHAFEAARQFGEATGDDPSIRPTIDRRARISAWLRVFLLELERAEGISSERREKALRWMGENQTHLADIIYAMDRAAKLAEQERSGPEAIADPDVVNRIGQAATLQAHMRFLVEALTS